MLKILLSIALLVLLLLAACDLYTYGKLGGADKTITYTPSDEQFSERMDFLSGIWYSHYAGIGRLDGYRIGTWGAGGAEFTALMGAKASQFVGFSAGAAKTYTPRPAGASPQADDYFVFYDPTVYGQSDEGVGGSNPDGGGGTGFIGIVRAVNIFNGDKKRGAIIIEYLQGCAPRWLDRYSDAASGAKPFFGIYYRVLDANTVQMANSVNLAALYAGEPYYTEKPTLDEAIADNSIENEAEFISWGVVIPQDRE